MAYLTDQLSSLPLEKTWMRSRVDAIKNAPDGAKRWLRDLGKNAIEHAAADEEYVSKILEESNAVLHPEECYLLLHAIYTHDIGYRGGSAEHPRRSHDMIMQDPATYFLYDRDLAKAIALIGLAHGLNDLAEIPDSFPIDFLSKTMEFNLRYLGSLLLIGDEMDQGFLRVFNTGGQERSPRNNVYHIEIGPQLAKIRSRPENIEQWNQLRKIVDNMQTRLDYVAPLLRQRNVKLEHVMLFPKVWAQQMPNNEQIELKESHTRLHHNKNLQRILVILDKTTFGNDVLRSIQAQNVSVEMLPIYSELISGQLTLEAESFDVIIWFLGEDFDCSVSKAILNFVSSEVLTGTGLIMFPFVAWSVSQGLNDMVDHLLPVALEGLWYEGKTHQIDVFREHPLTEGIKKFSIKNTYERLIVKEGAECLIQDSDGIPFLVVGNAGKGRVAYFNVCSHLCEGRGSIISPWQQAGEIPKLFGKTVAWVQRAKVGAEKWNSLDDNLAHRFSSEPNYRE